MLNLKIKDPQFFRKRSTGSAIRTIDLETEPAPTIMATGLRSVSCDKYWIEEGEPTVRASDPAKPPYRVPSMEEIRKIKPNGFRAISLFAGAGGSSLGYRMAGFKMLWASEFVDAARQVYEVNKMPYTVVDGRDVREVDPEEVMRSLGLKPGDLDVLDGSPPCASFSTAGKRDKHWGQEKKYCVDLATPILMADLRWKAASELVDGDQVIAFDEESAGGRRRKFRQTTVVSLKRLIQPSVRITTSDGASVICSADHRWLFEQGTNLRWRIAKRLRVGMKLLSIGRPWAPDETYDGGYLSGIFDGEGSVSKQTDGATRLLCFAQKPGDVLDRSLAILRRSGIRFGLYPQGGGTITVNINGGPFGKARALGIFRPVRLLKKANLLWEGVDVGAAEKVEITSIEFLGDREVVAVSTEAKTFIADGLLSHNSDRVQRTDDLFFEYVRFVQAFQPKVFVAENVSGLVKGVAKGYFLEILAALKACGYRVEAQLLDAQWLGVPQARQRIIFVGVRNDLDLPPAHPKPLPYRYSVRDAIPWIVGSTFSTGGANQAKNPRLGADDPAHSITAGAKNATHHMVEARIVPGDRGNRRRREEGKPHALDEPLTSVLASGGRKNSSQFMVQEPRIVQGNGSGHSSSRGDTVSLDRPLPSVNAGSKGSGPHQFYVEGESDISEQAIGREWDRLNPGEQSDRYFSLVRTDQNEPCPTVTAAGGQNSGIATVTHPTEKRKFSIAELKRICSFPDSFILSGSYAQQWERLGRAVPPMMMKAIAEVIRDRILFPCAERQKNASGRKSKSAAKTNAGSGRDRGPARATVTSGTATNAGSSHRTSSRSKKRSAVASVAG